jgi:hypothetical protein|tara:strand:- start:524 stop:733 length:210 start_codon:yes stop_codon:yes gene_type:complete
MAKKQRATSSKRKGTKSTTKKKGKKMNEFMKTLLDAKKKKLESFKYKGKMYKRHVGTKKNPKFVYYKKA